jgi:S1-C subfamily serine protease
MKARLVVAAVCAAALVGCAGAPKSVSAPPTLPQAQLDQVKTLLGSGSYLQALAEIDALRRAKPDAPDMDSLNKQALDALAQGFTASVTKKDFAAGLRLLDSARALGKADIAGSWTEKALLQQIASAQAASGDKVLELLTRLRIVGLSDAAESDFTEAASAAAAIGNRAVIGPIVTAMKAHGFAVPADLAAANDAAAQTPTFPAMISGTVTIVVDRGIKVEKGVGYPDRVIGSGFFIDKRGYILTNHHVVESEVDPKYEGYSRMYVRLSNSPVGERIPAKVVGYDSTFDLALIKAEITPSYTFGNFGGETMAPGERVFAIGSPAGLEETLTSGIISATGRRLLQVGDSVQVDVPLNPGNSGGPLLNEHGDVIGIVFAGIQQFAGLNFAIPFTWVQKTLPQLYKGGQAVHPWLGMAVVETEKGLEVVYTVPDEPAAQAGIAVGDIIESVNGSAYAKLADIQSAVLDHEAQTLVTVGVRRGEERFTAMVCLNQRPDQPIEVALKRDTRDNVVYPLFGMQLENVGSFLWKGDYIVKRVTRGSIADESGISQDDPLTVQDWIVDTDKGYAAMQVVIKKKRAGFVESAIQIAAYLETDNFI